MTHVQVSAEPDRPRPGEQQSDQAPTTKLDADSERVNGAHGPDRRPPDGIDDARVVVSQVERPDGGHEQADREQRDEAGGEVEHAWRFAQIHALDVGGVGAWVSGGYPRKRC